MAKTGLNQVHGTLFPASGRQKAVIVATGSDGGQRWAKQIARAFAAKGVSAFSLAYWGEKGLPKTLSLIPIEGILSAEKQLKEQGYQKIGLYGFSKGAELALTAASLLPEISFVVAVSPACCVFEGIAKSKYSGASSWQWQGRPLPYADFEGIEVSVSRISERHTSMASHRNIKESLPSIGTRTIQSRLKISGLRFCYWQQRGCAVAFRANEHNDCAAVKGKRVSIFGIERAFQSGKPYSVPGENNGALRLPGGEKTCGCLRCGKGAGVRTGGGMDTRLIEYNR